MSAEDLDDLDDLFGDDDENPGATAATDDQAPTEPEPAEPADIDPQFAPERHQADDDPKAGAAIDPDNPKNNRYSEDLWTAVRLDFEAGQLSYAQLSAKWGPNPSVIQRRAVRERWKRDLTSDVRRRFSEALLEETAQQHGEITGRGTDGAGGPTRGPMSPEEVVEAAARSQVQVVRQHRNDLRRLSKMVETLAGRLEDYLEGRNPNLPLFGPKDSVAQLVESLTRAMRNLIPLERQAFNLDKDESPEASARGIEERVRKAQAAERSRIEAERREQDSQNDADLKTAQARVRDAQKRRKERRGEVSTITDDDAAAA